MDKIRKISKYVKYTQEMHEQAFYLWYKMGKPELGVVARVLREQNPVGSPITTTLIEWKKVDSWDTHADTLDGIADNAMDKEIVKQRAELIRKQSDIGKELIDLGMGYLREHGVESSADAIRAIGKGAELQEKELGWAAVFAELSVASNDELDKKLRSFMEEKDGKIIEGVIKDADTDAEPSDQAELES